MKRYHGIEARLYAFVRASVYRNVEQWRRGFAAPLA